MRRLAVVLATVAALLAPAAAQAAITEHPLPAGSGPLGIAQSPDGSIWALEDEGASIDRIGADGTVARFPAVGYSSLVDATFDTAGTLWFTGGRSERLGRAPAGLALGPISTWLFGCETTGIATGSDGGIWFAKPGCDVVGRIAPASAPNSAHDDVSLPSGTQPMRVAVGPDGALWFTAYGNGRIGRVGADGRVSWPVPGGLDRPYDLVTGPDGNLWVTESGGAGAIVRVTPTGAITRFSAGLSPNAAPQGIAVGADGNLYVAAYRANAIARVGTDGTITEIALRAGAGPRGIVGAADGSVWFTAHDGDWVGRLTADPAPQPTPAPTPDARPTPELGRTVVAAPVRGTVRVTVPGARRSFRLRGADDVPVGSTFDTRDGRVSITSALPGNRTQRGNFWGGFFKVRQSRSRSIGGMTTLELRSNLNCGRASAAAARKRKNTLWGSDRRGRFRTKGRNATATVRGTVWRTIDRCDGTLVTVQSGSVTVRDTSRRRSVTVRRGHSYLARNRTR